MLLVLRALSMKTVNLENGAVVSPKSYTLDDLDDDDINDETKDIIRQVKNSLPKNVDNVKINVSYSNDIEAEIETERLKTGQAVMLRFMLNAGYPFLRRF